MIRNNKGRTHPVSVGDIPQSQHSLVHIQVFLMDPRYQSETLLLAPELLDLSLRNLACASLLVAHPAGTNRPSDSTNIAGLRTAAEDVFDLDAACKDLFFGCLLGCFVCCCFFRLVCDIVLRLCARGAAQCLVEDEFLLLCSETLAILKALMR